MLVIRNLFPNESFFPRKSKSRIPGGNSELYPRSKGISCGSTLPGTKLCDSGGEEGSSLFFCQMIGLISV